VKPTLADPLEFWKSSFGDAYTDRNAYADWKVDQGVQVFQRILEGLEIQSVLEVGSNIGINLLAIHRLFQGRIRLYAVEPNQKAFARLTGNLAGKLAGAWNCDAFQIPLADAAVDLALTCGVLIHISPKRLAAGTAEIVRVSRKYVLCIEYFSHTPTEIPYRGMTSLLFKRDFGGFYLDHHPELRPVNYGFIWQREFKHYDNLNWWLFEKIGS
jgi:pseudaminic acid biosynthesis-associated methylase